MSNKTYPILITLLLLAVGVLTACGSGSSTPTPEPDQVILQLNWNHEAEFAGYYVADAKGFFTDENLNVTILEGGMTAEKEFVDYISALTSGQVDFAVLGMNDLRIALDGGESVQAVMAVQQMSPQVLFARSDSGIKEPQDFVGKRVAIKGEQLRQLLHSMLANAGVDPTQVIEVDVAYDAIAKWYDGEVDVWMGYVYDEPVEAELAGIDVNLIFPGDYGMISYEGMIGVRQETLDQNSDMVGRFVRACLRGWQYTIEHPDEAAQITNNWETGKDIEHQEQAVRALIPLIDTGQVPIGWMDADRWIAAMGADYDPVYTMQFVEAAQ